MADQADAHGGVGEGLTVPVPQPDLRRACPVLLDTRLRGFQDLLFAKTLVVCRRDLGEVGRVVLSPGDQRQGEEEEKPLHARKVGTASNQSKRPRPRRPAEQPSCRADVGTPVSGLVGREKVATMHRTREKPPAPG